MNCASATVLACLLGACGVPTGGNSDMQGMQDEPVDDISSTQESETTQCIERRWGCDEVEVELDCALPTPCAPLEVYDPKISGDGAEGESVSFQNPEAAACIFENLNERIRGLYVVRTQPGGPNHRSIRLQLIADDKLWVTHRTQEDDCRYGQQRSGGIVSAAALAACKTSSRAAEQYECFDEVLIEATGCVGPQSECAR